MAKTKPTPKPIRPEQEDAPAPTNPTNPPDRPPGPPK